MRGVCSLCPLAAVLACSRPSVPPVGPTTSAEEEVPAASSPDVDVGVGDLVFIPPGAKMYVRADLAAPYVALRDTGSVREVKAVEGGFLRISTAGLDPETCAESRAPLRSFDLELFVDVEALGQVTAERVVHEFGDGTRLELAPGTPVRPLSSGGFEVHGDRSRRREARAVQPRRPLLPASRRPSGRCGHADRHGGSGRGRCP